MTDTALIALEDTLPPLWRLALAYAPGRVRPLWLGMMALDVRLAGVVAQAREPMLAQIRLAWWRDRLGEAADTWPKGEPLLAQLAHWQGQHGALVGLVDGWDALLADSPLPAATLAALGEGRAEAARALAQLAGVVEYGDSAARLARGWALGDLAGVVDHPQDGDIWRGLAEGHDWRRPWLPRALRPLSILAAFAARQSENRPVSGLFAIATGLRLGIIGR